MKEGEGWEGEGWEGWEDEGWEGEGWEDEGEGWEGESVGSDNRVHRLCATGSAGRGSGCGHR